jgi:hypothetical protein
MEGNEIMGNRRWRGKYEEASKKTRQAGVDKPGGACF